MTAGDKRSFASGMALALVGSVLFSAKAVVVKLAYRHGVDAATLIALRMLVAAPFFAWAYAWSSRGKEPLAPSDHARLVVLGLLGYYAASYLDFLGLQYVTAGLERLILYLNPTIVVLLSVSFYGRKLRRADALALVLAYGGIAAAFWHDVHFGGDNVALGAALVFGSAMSYALYLVRAGELVKRLGAIRLTSYAMLVSTAAIAMQFAVLNSPSAIVQPMPVYWLSLLNGVLCTVVPVIATMMAVERFGAASTSMVSMVGPLSTIALAWLFLGEPISLWQTVGTALVLTGIFVHSRSGIGEVARPAGVPSKPATRRWRPE